MATLLVTGATGTVGQNVIRLLLERGHEVIVLVRPKNGEDPKGRIRKILPGHERLSVLVGNILDPFAGVSAGDIARLCGTVDALVHGAASIKFVETPDRLIERTNIEGTKNVLNLASALRVPRLYYISTAYVCGNASYFSEQDQPLGPHIHRNPYERSKAIAETLVRQSGIPYAVLRPSIVTGDFVTGYTVDFNGLTGWFESLFRMGVKIRNEWGQNPRKLLDAGISVDREGIITLPITINATAIGPLNLVPRDWVGNTIVGLLEIPPSNTTFHVTHSNPPSVKYVIDEGLKHLGIRGIKLGPGNNLPPNRLSAMQRTIRTQLAQFDPYTSKDVEEFSDTNTRKALGSDWVPPPSITSDYLGRALSYAVSRNFGRERETVEAGRT